jgi:hypothetical protein
MADYQCCTSTKMKRSRSERKKELSKIEGQHALNQRTRKLRGKYKHLDLMTGLVEARKEERQPASKNATRDFRTFFGDAGQVGGWLEERSGFGTD